MTKNNAISGGGEMTEKEQEEQEEQIVLLKSGDFTIAYHDSGYCSLHVGKKPYSKLPQKNIGEFDGCSVGYIPDIVQMLVRVLGGKVVTI